MDFDPSAVWRLFAVPKLSWPNGVIAKTNIPVEGAAVNDSYLVGINPQSIWIDHQNQIAIWSSDNAWVYQLPVVGRQVWENQTKQQLRWDGREWVLANTSSLPAGGDTGFILAKRSNADYDAEWIQIISGGSGVGGAVEPGDPSNVKLFENTETISGLEAEGTLGIILGQGFDAYRERGLIYQVSGGVWVLRGRISQFGIPEGGTTGQVLAKTSNTSFEADWIDPEDVGGGAFVESISAGSGILVSGTSTVPIVSVKFGTASGEAAQGDDSRLSNDRTASGIRTATGVVAVSTSTAPTAGQSLVATSGTAAAWGTVTPSLPVRVNGSLIGTRPAVNLIAGSGVTLSGVDDSTNNRVNVTVNSSGGGGGAGDMRFPYVAKPDVPDSWNFEARDASDPDLAANGFVVQDQVSPFATWTRAGNVDITTDPSSKTYRSTFVDGTLFIQLSPGQDVTIAKATTSSAYTYKFRVWNDTFATGNNHLVWISNDIQFGQSGTTAYYVGAGGGNNEEVTWVGPSTFNVHQSISGASLLTADTVVEIDAISTTSQSSKVMLPWSGVQLLSRIGRTSGVTVAYAGMWAKCSSGQLLHIDFIRRTPLYELP